MTSDTQEVTPDPKLEKRARRIFTTEYKLSLLQQANACQHGELGPLLRVIAVISVHTLGCERQFTTVNGQIPVSFIDDLSIFKVE